MPLRVSYVGARALCALALASVPVGCECAGGQTPDASVEAGVDGGMDGGRHRPDAGLRDAGGQDAGSSDTGIEPPVMCEEGCLAPCQPNRCQDEPIPGFRLRPDGWYDPCNCFEAREGEVRAIPTSCVDQGLRTVPFDCSWPPGTIFHRGYLSTYVVEVGAQSCDYTCDTVTGGFFLEPYYETFVVAPDPRLPHDRVCFPSECVFDTPGEPARCSDSCTPFNSEIGTYFGRGAYVTVYRVDRSACDDPPDAGTGAGADAGTYPEFPYGCP